MDLFFNRFVNLFVMLCHEKSAKKMPSNSNPSTSTNTLQGTITYPTNGSLETHHLPNCPTGWDMFVIVPRRVSHTVIPSTVASKLHLHWIFHRLQERCASSPLGASFLDHKSERREFFQEKKLTESEFPPEA